MHDYVYIRTPNIQLTTARLRHLSPSGSGRYMSRAELADAVNDHFRRHLGLTGRANEDYVGRLERGVHRWPNCTYRKAFRAVLGVRTDAEIGFYNSRRQTVGVWFPEVVGSGQPASTGSRRRRS